MLAAASGMGSRPLTGTARFRRLNQCKMQAIIHSPFSGGKNPSFAVQFSCLRISCRAASGGAAARAADRKPHAPGGLSFNNKAR